MDLEVFKNTLPAELKKFATKDLLDELYNTEPDAIMRERIEENLISYTSVLTNSNYDIKDYLKAVIYVSHKLTGLNREKCYAKTFPDRYAVLIAAGTPTKTIKRYATSYESTKLVVGLLESAIVPVWLLNQPLYQRALNVQADLMMTANSEKVRCDAANSILAALSRPKEIATPININVNTSEIDSLKKAMVDLASNQKARIIEGESVKTIAGESL